MCTTLYLLLLLPSIGQCQFTTSWSRYREISSFPFLSFPNDSLHVRRFVFLLSSLLVWLAVFHTVASLESKILLQKSWPKPVHHHFWLLNRNFQTAAQEKLQAFLPVLGCPKLPMMRYQMFSTQQGRGGQLSI